MGVTALPADMQTALAQGRLTAADARAWVGISKSALLCKLATAMPSVRDKLVGAPPCLHWTSPLASCAANETGRRAFKTSQASKPDRTNYTQ